MPTKLYFINQDNFHILIANFVSSANVIAPLPAFGQYHLTAITTDNLQQVSLQGFRSIESFKPYFFKITEKVTHYFDQDLNTQSHSLVMLGARGCDLEAMEVLDRVFGEGQYKDPAYLSTREKVFIIGADCTNCADTCFCSLVKGLPYPVKLFDINLSPMDNGFAVEARTDAGKKLVKDHASLFEEASYSAIKQRDANRQKVKNLLAQKNAKYNLKLDIGETHKINLENKIWKKLTCTCVECSNCNFICPSCSCFFLADQAKERHDERYKIWDACLKNAYAKVAGGGNSRPLLYQRLQNRYHCKFDYSFDRLGRYTCVGCGRCCKDGCAGNIDMRQVFVELEKQVPLSAKLE